MANQIGKFFVSQKSIDSVAGIADHLRRYWDPKMRAAIVAHLVAGGEGLDTEARQAVALLASKAVKPANAELPPQVKTAGS